MLSIQQHVDLLPYNTFGIKAFAKYFVIVRSVEEVRELLRSDLFKKEKHLVLGGGSNILLTQNYDGLVIKVELKGKEIVKQDEDTVTVKVGSGENWHEFVLYCVVHNWGGVENLSLIPGTVGAAPMQNIGAYGVEIKKNIFAVEAIEMASGDIRIFTNSECLFGYRESIFKHQYKDKYFISSVTLTLAKKNHRFNISYGAIEDIIKKSDEKKINLKAISDAVISIRQSKLPDPAIIGNAGSFFKNPSIDLDLHDLLKSQHPSIPSYPGENGLIKIPAAWLIEQCGWRGKTFDNIGIHKDQALVLVNYGGGEGEKIWQLAMNIRDSVREKFGVLLHPEVNMI